jgi:hypothetical protein
MPKETDAILKAPLAAAQNCSKRMCVAPSKGAKTFRRTCGV